MSNILNVICAAYVFIYGGAFIIIKLMEENYGG